MYEERHNTALDHFKPRITLNSTHKNLYEFPEGNIQVPYCVGRGFRSSSVLGSASLTNRKVLYVA